MNRETILKHSKAIRLKQMVLPDIVDVIAEFCTIKGHPEYISAIIQLLQQHMIGKLIIDKVLEYFKKEYHIIKLEKINVINKEIFDNIENKQLINIY